MLIAFRFPVLFNEKRANQFLFLESDDIHLRK